MTTLVLPELGENIEAADVTAVLVAIGDRIAPEQPVIEVETEKASLEVPATTEGRVAELLVKVGDTIRVGQAILVVESGSPVAAVASGPAEPAAPAEPPVSAEPAAPAISEGPAERARPARPAASPVPLERSPEIGETVTAAPAVRALARELGVDLRDVPGTGPAGRITREDVKAWVRSAAHAGGSAVVPAAPGLPDFARWGAVRREPLSRIRRATAAAMTRSWSEIPHVTQHDRSDITRLEDLRRDFNRRPEAAVGKLTVTAIVLKIAAAALRRFPKFNASLDTAAGEALYKDYVHIGIAVDTERGLLVPVIRDADRKPLPRVAAELGELSERARTGKLTPDEMNGATFTVSNLGGLGTTFFTPIVNWPEVAILGVGRAEVQAVSRDGRFEPRTVLPLSISYDHRWIDGAEAARFVRWIAEALEQPLLLLLDGDARGPDAP